MQRRISKTQKQEVNWIDEGSCLQGYEKGFFFIPKHKQQKLH
jgi:hypothetical protein